MPNVLITCSGAEDEFISVSVSQDVEDNVGAGCCIEMTKSAIPVTNALLPSQLEEEFPIPKPMSTWEVEDFKEALLMGDHEALHYMSDQALLGIPSPKLLVKKLKQANLRRQREIRVGSLVNYRFWPLLPLCVKAEINPLLATLEVLCTFIVLVTWANVIIFGATGVPMVGGIALFVAYSILHYWYGFTRYHSTFQGYFCTGMLTGKALDKNFDRTRDICSYQCHGDMERRSQSGALLLTAPFTILNHFTSLIVYGTYKLLRVIRRSKTPESPALALMWGASLTNVAFTVMMLWGGTSLMTYTVLNFIINQRLYNAMLFRRNFKGFMVSFLFGNLLIGDKKTSTDKRPSSPLEEIIVSSSGLIQDEGMEQDFMKRRDIPFGETKQASRSISYVENDIEQISSASIDDDVLYESKETPNISNSTSFASVVSRSSVSSTDNTMPKDAAGEEAVGASSKEAVVIELQRSTSIATQEYSMYSSETSPSDFSGTDFWSSGGDDSTLEGAPILPASDQNDVNEKETKAPGQTSMDFLNDVYLQNGDGNSPLDSHPGTRVWYSVIQEATETFSCSPFGDKHHDWITGKLGARDVYTGNIEYGWTRLSPIQVRNKCKESYEKFAQAIWDSKPKRNSNIISATPHTKEDVPSKPTSVPAEIKKKTFGKLLLQRIRSNPRPLTNKSTGELKATNAVRSDSLQPDSNMNKKPIYLGQRDNPGYQHFLKVVKLAAVGGNSKEYGDDTHDWVISRTNARSFHIKMSSGTFQKASEDEVQKHAAECFAEAIRESESEKMSHKMAALGSPEPSIEVCEGAGDAPKAKWKKRYLSLQRKKIQQQYQQQQLLLHHHQQQQKHQSTNTNLNRGQETEVADAHSSNHFSLQAIEVALQFVTSTQEKLISEEGRDHEQLNSTDVDDSRDPFPSKAPPSGSIGTTDVEGTREELDGTKKQEMTRSKVLTPHTEKKISPLREEQKEDPELVKKWIVEQTKSLRTRSRFFGSLWSRARKLRRKNIIDKSAMDEQWQVDENGLIQPVFSDEGTDDHEDEKRANKGPRRLSSFRVKWFKTKSSQPEDNGEVACENNDDEEDIEETKEAKETEELQMEEPSFYDLIMAVLVEDYFKSQPSKTRDLHSDDQSLDSTITSAADSIVSRVEPRSMLEFVEHKIEEEILFSRFCIGDSTCSGLQCGDAVILDEYWCRPRDQCGELLVSASACVRDTQLCGTDTTTSSTIVRQTSPR